MPPTVVAAEVKPTPALLEEETAPKFAPPVLVALVITISTAEPLVALLA
jgi:hypothetical protein